MSIRPLEPTTVVALPNDTAAEDEALCALLNNGPEHLRAVVRMGLTPDAFYGPGRRTIYESVLTLAEHGEAFDAAAVSTQLRATQKATKQTEAALLAVLNGSGLPNTKHAELVVAKHLQRRDVHALNDALQRRLAGESVDLAALAGIGAEAASFRPEALDLAAGSGEEHAYLREPYLPRAARIWAVGPAEAAKSMWAAWVAAGLTREGYRVVYLSQENPEGEDRRRWTRLNPDLSRLALYHGQGFDLALPEHRAALRGITDGADLLVLDTLTACWSGDENDNAAAVAFDRDALYPIVKAGCSVLTIHHTGHPGGFGERKDRARGASSFGQKADVELLFAPEGEPGGFRITHKKNRLGGYKAPVSFHRVADLESGGLTITTESRSLSSYAEADADVAVALIRGVGRVIGKKALHAALLRDAGLSHQRAWAAIALSLIHI